MNDKKPFNNEKYLAIQRENILKRIDLFGGRLYLEFGGKLFDDYHALRVLPGFELKPGQYYVLLASGDTKLTNTYTHTNFKIH